MTQSGEVTSNGWSSILDYSITDTLIVTHPYAYSEKGIVLNVGKAHIKVPLLTNEGYETGPGGFHGFPTRLGYKDWSVDSTNFDFEFLQRWLWHGFIVEIFAIWDVKAEWTEFEDDIGENVSTEVLPEYMRRWRRKARRFRGSDSPEAISRIKRTAEILRLVSRLVERYNIPYNGSLTVPEPEEWSPLPQSVWMSIIGLGHTFTQGLISYLDIRGLENRWPSSPLLRRRMMRKGWCRSDVHRITDELSIDGHYFLSKLDNPNTSLSHDKCTLNECVARNIDEDTYQNPHLRSVQDCRGYVAASVTKLSNIIEEGKVPVFRWDAKRRHLDIMATELYDGKPASLPYVCISHVWSDGLGDPFGNKMLECRLRDIQNKVDSAAKEHASKFDSTPTHFWMDTLAVPVGDGPGMKELRRKCIGQMAKIYTNCTFTLVLSSAFWDCPTDATPPELGMTYYLANWARRLWTYQEGMLPPHVLVQFADRAVPSIKDLFEKEERRSVARGHCVTFPLSAVAKFEGDSTIREMIARQHGAVDINAIFTPTVQAMQARSTTRRSDEAICIATALHLDVHPLQEAEGMVKRELKIPDPESDKGWGSATAEERKAIRKRYRVDDAPIAAKRMEILMGMIKRFPPSIIFNGQKRLNKDGFRWAPASWLGMPPRAFIPGADNLPEAELDAGGKGLAVRLPGFCIEAPEKRRERILRVISEKLRKKFPDPLTAEIRSEQGSTVKLSITPTNDLGEAEPFKWVAGATYAIIILRPIAESTSESEDGSDDSPKAELERWLADLFRQRLSSTGARRAVLGRVLTKHFKSSEPSAGVQLRHECLADVHILSPAQPELLAEQPPVRKEESISKTPVNEGTVEDQAAADEIQGDEEAVEDEEDEAINSESEDHGFESEDSEDVRWRQGPQYKSWNFSQVFDDDEEWEDELERRDNDRPYVDSEAENDEECWKEGAEPPKTADNAEDEHIDDDCVRVTMRADDALWYIL